MSNYIRILGSGSSLGSPWITRNWGLLNKKNKKNIRTRCCAHIKYKNLSILIDTSPDLKKQFLDNNITNLDAVLYSHEHADQTSGIFELRPFLWKNKKKIKMYGSKRTISQLRNKYDFIFTKKQGYLPIGESKIISNHVTISKGNTKVNFKCFEVRHGEITSTAYVFNKVAYISDCKNVDRKHYKHLDKLNLLIIDCLKFKSHPGHFNFEESIEFAKKINAKKTVLTNLHVDLDYNFLLKNTPKNFYPAYDGMKLSF